MVRRLWFALFVCTLALIAACGRQSGNPTAPSATSLLSAGAAADGSTLKASIPVPQSPSRGERLTSPEVTLVAVNSTGRFVTDIALSYRFEIYDAAGARVFQSGQVPQGSSGTTSLLVTAALQGDQTYTWQVRAEYLGELGAFTAWSGRESFIAASTTGYIRGNELYDPLINGRTVGQIHGPVTFVPGLGARLEGQDAYISYELQSTLFEGEFSIIVTNLAANTKGGKTKLFAMGQGYGDIVTNEYRATFEKRGDPPGIVAWRFIARDDQIDTEGAEREYVPFDASRTYFWQATWRNNRLDLIINDGGVFGSRVYARGKHWEGRGYEPKPHVIYLGAPVGRSGLDGASVNGVIIRQVWVSGNPRPTYANQ